MSVAVFTIPCYTIAPAREVVFVQEYVSAIQTMKYKLTFAASELRPAFECEFEDFPAEKWQILLDFMSFSDEAHRTRFASELPTYKVSFHFTNSGVVRNAGRVPDEEALWAFLHKYRPILLKKEPTAFAQVCSIVVNHINHSSFTMLTREWKTQYSGKALREIMTIEQGDIVLIGQTFLDSYLNAFEYHRDRELRCKLADFTKWFEPEARIGLVTLLLTMKFCAVSELRRVIRELQALKRQAGTLNEALRDVDADTENPHN